MQKLELKYWCSHLPYKPTILHFDKQFKNGFEIHKLHGITEDARYNAKKLNKYEKHLLSEREITFWLENGTGLNNNAHDVKLALRPLSDLTKEIDVDGEKFIPIDILWNETLEQVNSDTYDDYFFNEDLETTWINIDNVLRLEYIVVEKLIEWNFDVFGLIEKGLAIDINTLNK